MGLVAIPRVVELRWSCTEYEDVPPLESSPAGSGIVGGPVSLVTPTQPCAGVRLPSTETQAGRHRRHT